MICNRCLFRLSRRTVVPGASRTVSHPTNIVSQPTVVRTFAQSVPRTAQTVDAQTATATNPRPHDTVSAATSTSAAQPFSTPNTPAPQNIPDLPISPDQTKQPAAHVQSSVPAGTILKGLNFLKNASDPVAKADNEYPPWLWTVLDSSSSNATAGGDVASDGDLFSKSKKLRRRAAKALRRAALENPEALMPKIPLQQQSVDLPSGDGSVGGAWQASDARQELTKAMRDQRRKSIKTDNFLREMR